MKVALINSLYHPNFLGGAERVVQRLAEDLVSSGHDVVVLATVPGRGQGTRNVNGVAVRDVSLRNLYWPFDDGPRPALLKPTWHAIDSYNPVMTRTVLDILREEQPDVVNTHTLCGFSVGVWSAAKRLGLPLVHTLHDYYLLCPKASRFRRGRTCERQCTSCHLYSSPRRRLSAHVDGVIGVSRYVLDLHARFGFFPKASVRRVVHNQAERSGNGGPVTGSTASPAPNGRGPLKLGYLGRLHPTKGLELAIHALQGLPADRWRLLVGGKGERAYEGDLVRRFGGGNVSFLGLVQQDRFLPSIDVLIVPSLWEENSPRVIYEAFAHGVPVVCSNRGGMPELVDQGKTGFVFDPERPGQLSQLVGGLLDRRDLLRSMSTRCLQAAARFRPESVASEYLRTYQDLMGP